MTRGDQFKACGVNVSNKSCSRSRLRNNNNIIIIIGYDRRSKIYHLQNLFSQIKCFLALRVKLRFHRYFIQTVNGMCQMVAREHFVVRVLWEHYWSTGGQNIASSTEKAHIMRVLRRPNYREYWLGVWVLRDPESTVNFIPAIIPKQEINTGVPALSVVRSLEILRVLELHTPRSKYF